MSNNLRTYPHVVKAEGNIPFAAVGDFLRCTKADASFQITFDDGPAANFEQGLGYSPLGGFTRVTLTNPHAFDITIEIAIGTGEMQDSRLSLPEDLVAFTGAAKTISNGKFEVASGKRVLIAEADVDRLELIVSNMGLAPVFLGDENVIWAQGLPLASAHTATLKTRSAIYAYAQADGTQTLSILETFK